MADDVLRLAVRIGVHATSVHLWGEVDVDTAPLVRAALVSLVERNKQVSVDLRGVSFLDSSGLAALADAASAMEHCDEAGLVVLGPLAPRVQKVFEVTGFSSKIAMAMAPDDER